MSATTSGRNELYGGSGADIIVADTPVAIDFVYAGAGDDTVFADSSDVVAPNCENVYR